MELKIISNLACRTARSSLPDSTTIRLQEYKTTFVCFSRKESGRQTHKRKTWISRTPTKLVPTTITTCFHDAHKFRLGSLQTQGRRQSIYHYHYHYQLHHFYFQFHLHLLITSIFISGVTNWSIQLGYPVCTAHQIHHDSLQCLDLNRVYVPSRLVSRVVETTGGWSFDKSDWSREKETYPWTGEWQPGRVER